MSPSTPLTHTLLIALPQLDDKLFRQSVVIICEHNEAGAMGFILNKPLHFNLGSVLSHLDIETHSKRVANQLVLMGGPLGQENGFILSPEKPQALNMSSSRQMLTQIANEQGPEDCLVFLGYSAWQAGQLEAEINQGDWLTLPYNSELVFNTPLPQRWASAIKLAGFDICQLSHLEGHA